MTLDNIGIIFDCIMFLGCVYCGYSWLWMHKNGQIHKNPILISSRISIRDCKDVKGYLRYMSPRLLAFSLVGMVFGAVNIYGALRGLSPDIALLAIALLFADIIWFAAVIHQSVKRFWDAEPTIRL